MKRSWVEGADASAFSLANLPYGCFVRPDGGLPHVGVAIGDAALDLSIVARKGLIDGALPNAVDVFGGTTLNPLLRCAPADWKRVRGRLGELLALGNRELLDAGIAEQALVPQRSLRLHLPVEIGDYVDFYSSLEHATNLGKILRPGGEPLLPNWRWMPIGYHGRSSTVVVSGNVIARPAGQRKPVEGPPDCGPTRMLDFELELGFITGDGPALGTPIDARRAAETIFGVVLVNDWSARDIQGWEYQPLGPFLAKSFATSISPWVVPLEALEPYRCEQPAQEPPPLEYLRTQGPQAYDIDLRAELATSSMRRAQKTQEIAHTNARYLYWSMAQQLAHATVNGARVRAGDLFASGTISGPQPGSYGSLIELTWRGRDPLHLGDGETRTFLEDGDSVTLRGECAADGKPRIGFGTVEGTVVGIPYRR